MKAAVHDSYNHFSWKEVAGPVLKPDEVLARIQVGIQRGVLHQDSGRLKPHVLISKGIHGSEIQKAFKMIQEIDEKYLKVLLDFCR